MKLLIVGINHNSAPVELREKVAFTPEQLPGALASLQDTAGLSETAILSTCNRTEIIAIQKESDPVPVVSWLADYHRLGNSEANSPEPRNIDSPEPSEVNSPELGGQLAGSIYVKVDQEAVHHALRVACGLDSMVMGEPQILGQFKECFDTANRCGTLGAELHHLAQNAFRIAKRVRTETAIGENSLSLAATSVSLAERLFSDLSACRALLIGAGETSALVAKHLASRDISHLTIANRSLGRAAQLAAQFNAEALDLQSIPMALPKADLVIASTAAQLPILGKGLVERAIKQRKHRPILMVDLAVPRDIEPEVAELADIYLYTVDDLQQIVTDNLKERTQAAQAAEVILAEELATYQSHSMVRVASNTVSQFRDLHHQLKDKELAKALKRLEKGDQPAAVLEALANQLLNKWMHSPSVALREATRQGDQALLEAAKQLYSLGDEQDE